MNTVWSLCSTNTSQLSVVSVLFYPCFLTLCPAWTSAQQDDNKFLAKLTSVGVMIPTWLTGCIGNPWSYGAQDLMTGLSSTNTSSQELILLTRISSSLFWHWYIISLQSSKFRCVFTWGCHQRYIGIAPNRVGQSTTNSRDIVGFQGIFLIVLRIFDWRFLDFGENSRFRRGSKADFTRRTRTWNKSFIVWHHSQEH